jgi:hypothetical protein
MLAVRFARFQYTLLRPPEIKMLAGNRHLPEKQKKLSAIAQGGDQNGKYFTQRLWNGLSYGIRL